LIRAIEKKRRRKCEMQEEKGEKLGEDGEGGGLGELAVTVHYLGRKRMDKREKKNLWEGKGSQRVFPERTQSLNVRGKKGLYRGKKRMG